MHLTNVAVQKTAPDYDPEKVCNSRTCVTAYLCQFFWNVSPLINSNLLFIPGLFHSSLNTVGMQVADAAASKIPDCKTRQRDGRNPV